MSGLLEMFAPSAIAAGRAYEVRVRASGGPGLARIRVVLTLHGNGTLDELRLGEEVVTTSATGEAVCRFGPIPAEPPDDTIVATASCLDPPYEGYYYSPATALVEIL